VRQVSHGKDVKVREMRTADTILNIIQDRGKRIGQSQRNKETGEPDDATSIKSGSEGGWEKRPKGPRSQPTRLQSSRSTFSRESFPSFFALKEDMWDTQISALLSSPTVSGHLLPYFQPYGPFWRYKYLLHKGLFITVILCSNAPDGPGRTIQASGR